MGYQRDIFLNAISEVFICVVCKEVVKYPKECQKCGILICAECTVSIFKNFYDAKCPKCEETLQVKQINRNTRQVLESYLVKCNRKMCDWKGCLEDLESHEKDEHPIIREDLDPLSDMEKSPKAEKQSKWSQNIALVVVEPEFSENSQEYTKKQDQELNSQQLEILNQEEQQSIFGSFFIKKQPFEKLNELIEQAWQPHLQLFNYAMNFNQANMHKSIIAKGTQAKFLPQENKGQFRVCVFPPKISIGPTYIWHFKLIKECE